MLHSEFFVMHSSSSVHFLSQRYMYVCMYFMFTLPYTEYIEEEGGGGGGGVRVRHACMISQRSLPAEKRYVFHTD